MGARSVEADQGYRDKLWSVADKYVLPVVEKVVNNVRGLTVTEVGSSVAVGISTDMRKKKFTENTAVRLRRKSFMRARVKAYSSASTKEEGIGYCLIRNRVYPYRKRRARELYDQPKVALSLKNRMVTAEASEALLYASSTWTLHQEHAKLRTVHHRVLLRIIGAQRKRPDHRMTSYNRGLQITRCESIETTLRTRRLLWLGTLI